MARSRASSIASHVSLGTSIQIDYSHPYSIQDSSSFQGTLQNFCTANDRKALLAALTETAVDRSNNDQVTPNELFIAILSALNSLTSSLEGKLKEGSGGVEKEVATVMSLLELLRRISPFVVHWENNEGALFVHQFPTISRSIRLLYALSSSLPAEQANTPGSGALCRQLLKTSTCLLLCLPSSGNFKEILLMLNVLVDMSQDPRPKVRKAALGSLLEICMVAFETSNDDSINNDSDDDDMEDGASRMKKSLQSQRVALSKKIYTHSHSILKSKKRDEIKTLHTLRFLENAVEYCGDDTMIQFGQACLSLLDTAPSVDVIRQSLSTLQAILHQCGGEEMNKFACRSCAFLLQHRPSESSLFTLYGRCLMGCVNHMVGSVKVEVSDMQVVATVQSKLLAFKLAPNVIRSMLHLCEVQEESCSEFNQLLSRITPILVECGYGSNSDDQLQRVSMETIPPCLAVIKEALQIQYRNAWGSLLSGGYATFTARLALTLLNRGDDEALKSHVTSLVLSLLRLRQDVEKDGTARTAVEYATSTIIRGMGLELFMTCVDFVNDDGEANQLQSTTTGGGIRDDRAWLLPLMKQSAPLFALESAMTVPVFTESPTTKTRLSFFQGRVLNLARRCDAASADGHRTAAEASIQKARVIEMWALLPAFCLYPVDVRENFPTLAKTLVKALSDYTRYPKLIPIICGALKILTIGVMQRFESQQSKQDYEILSNVSTKILPSLFKLVENLIQNPTSPADDAMDEDAPSSRKQEQANSQQNMQFVESVTDAIGYLARVCPREFLQNLFKKVVQKLLVASTDVQSTEKEENDLRMCSLLGLARSLVASESLDEASLSLLFRAIRPLVRTDEHDPRVQKRAYKVLAEICERHTDFVTSGEQLDVLIELLIESIVTAQVSVRHMRLKCMALIVSKFDSSNDAHMAIIPKIMGEVLLCLKDSNAKTRDAAYKLLLAMAVSRDDITEFFKIILAALGAQTAHMRSAAVMALSRLIYEYAREDEDVQELLPHLMTTVSVLFDDPAREVNKSVVGFVRVAVAAMSSNRLEPLLPLVVDGIMKYNRGKDRFRQKIKIILKKLVRLYGYDAIAPLVPNKDARLITHMRKLAERSARRKARGLEDGKTMAGDDFDNMMESDEDDSDDGRTFMTGGTGFTKLTSLTGKTTKRSFMDRSVNSKGARSPMTAKSAASKAPQIAAELKGEVLDLLDSSKMARSVRFADMNMKDGDFSDDEDDGGDEINFDNQGRIVISEGPPQLGGARANADDDSDDVEENLELKAGGKRRRVSKFESVKLNAAKSKKAKNNKQQQVQSLGAAYKNKKAGGDAIKKNQKYEPYAFVPLNAKDYTKKNRGKAVSKMGTVVHNNKRKRN